MGGWGDWGGVLGWLCWGDWGGVLGVWGRALDGCGGGLDGWVGEGKEICHWSLSLTLISILQMAVESFTAFHIHNLFF